MVEQEEKELYSQLLKDNFLKAKQFFFLITYHRGKENAIPRLKFLDQYFWLNSKEKKKREAMDREFRKFYSEEIPVVSCNEGIYWPEKPEDMEPILDDMIKKTIAMRTRWKFLSRMHNDLCEERQLSLFQEV